MHEKRKASISVILVMVFVLGLFVPMSQHARAAIPVPHNLYGHAFEWPGVGLGNGSLVTAWIDGVEYGWNLTFWDALDPDANNRSDKFDIDTEGNQVTQPLDPDTPWVKEGGDNLVDDIMYVWGRMEELVTGALGSNIFEQTRKWETFVSEYVNLSTAPTQPPVLPKISIIVTQPGDMGTQYIYIYGPQGTSMDEFYLEKNDGVLHNVATQIFLSGTISETTYFYVDLGATDYINPLGDELKLVWENPGGPGTPFDGMDVVVDRVEYNETFGGTHFGEPDNTIMPDASADSTIMRTPFAYTDTNDCLADFGPGFEPGRPPLAPYPLSVEGALAGPGQTIDHVTNRVNPNLDFMNQDPDSPFHFGYKMEVADDSAFTAIRWASYQIASSADNEDYAGTALSPGVCYYYRAKTKDAYDYGPWANTTMCMNTPPPIPKNIWPHNETVQPDNLRINWTNVTDAEGDLINYTLQVDESPLFGSIFHQYFGLDNWNIWNYTGFTNYSYRVNSHDGYEYSVGWSNESGYWWFNTTNPPAPPVPKFLAVEGFYEPDDGAKHLTNRVNPVFNWTFTDPNPGESQQAYDMEVWDGPGGTGSLMMSDSGGTAEQVTYTGPQLSVCLDYYFRVMVQDDSVGGLWSLDWAEMKFHSNCVPSIPDLLTPLHDAILTQSDTQVVDWDISTDLDPFDTITYEWVVDEDCPATVPYVASGTTPSTFSDQFVTVIDTHYNWTVRAYDEWEYSDWAVCFHFFVEIPNQRPGPALDLAVDGFTAAPEITHLLNPTPIFSWTFNDPDVGDTQAEIHVTVSTGPGRTGTIIWDYNDSYTPESIVYGGGIPPEPCNGYYFGISTADNNGWWARTSDWSEIYFHMNCAPTEPQPSLPADGAVETPSATQTVTWLPSTDADVPPDTITYTVQVDDSAALTAPFVLEETTTATTSSGFDTTGLGCFWWRVNATDGWESSIWSTTFSFCANNAPGLPDGLAVEGFMSGADLMHILVAEPAFNWTFVDPDAGDTQTAYELDVRTGPGGTGTSMWTYSGGTALTVNYNADSLATALVPGDFYYFRVRTMDAYEFGDWEELQFEMSAAPPAPALTTPTDEETDVSLTPTLTWAGVTDPNGDTVTYHWYVDTDATPTAPFTDNNTTAGTTATLSVTLTGSTIYYWMVCADDGWELPECSDVWSFTTTAPPNQPPVADAGENQTVVEGTNVTLIGTGTDPDGTIVLYEWDFTTDGTYDTTNTTSGTTTHIYATPGIYNATLKVTDDGDATDTDNVTITVTEAANLLPEADAGDDQEVDVDQAVTLNGSGTDDDGTIVLYEWDFENDGTWDWSSTTTGVTTHTYTSAGTFTARLRVTDNDGATATDDATIEVKEKEAEADFLSEYWWLLLIIIIIVILVIILLAKRKKPEEEEEEPAEEEEEAPPEEEPEEAPEEEEAAEEEKADMKECPNCGTVLATDDAECFMCGAKV